MSNMPLIISVKNVNKYFGKQQVLHNVSFSVSAGEIVGFVGANGAGKTTTIGTVLGFIAPSAGSVALFGQHLSLKNAHQSHRRVGYAAGDMQLPPKLTGKQYINFVLSQSSEDYRERFNMLCSKFSPQLDKKISTLSRGNKQKIALIAAFVTSPELLIFDEPTSGLDPVMQAVFLEILRDEQKVGTTIFMSSHYLEEVADVCSRVILMREGTIIEDISAQTLLKRSGKTVRIVSRSASVLPPKDATEVVRSTADGLLTVSFVFTGTIAELQRWLAALKLVVDIEVSEYNLEGAFRSMYEPKENVV